MYYFLTTIRRWTFCLDGASSITSLYFLCLLSIFHLILCRPSWAAGEDSAGVDLVLVLIYCLILRPPLVVDTGGGVGVAAGTVDSDGGGEGVKSRYLHLHLQLPLVLTHLRHSLLQRTEDTSSCHQLQQQTCHTSCQVPHPYSFPRWCPRCLLCSLPLQLVLDQLVFTTHSWFT